MKKNDNGNGNDNIELFLFFIDKIHILCYSTKQSFLKYIN